MRQGGGTEAPLMRGQLAIAGGPASAGVFASTANPFGQDVLIHAAHLRVTTIATGAATVSAGVAADAVTANAGLFDTLDVHSATGLFNIPHDGGTNGRQGAIWGAAQFLNVSETSGDVNGLVAVLHFTYSLLS